MKRHCGFHFHKGFYSRTYPRYENYTAMENERDMVDLIDTIYENKKREFEEELYYQKDGSQNPNFVYNVYNTVSSLLSNDLCVGILEVVKGGLKSDTLSAPVKEIVENYTQEIDITKIDGNQNIQDANGDGVITDSEMNVWLMNGGGA